jgi:hypothetical protein
MPFGANLLMRITGVWPTVSRMLANFAIGSSSVHHCPTDDIGHKGRLHTGVPGPASACDANQALRRWICAARAHDLCAGKIHRP